LIELEFERAQHVVAIQDGLAGKRNVCACARRDARNALCLAFLDCVGGHSGPLSGQRLRLSAYTGLMQVVVAKLGASCSRLFGIVLAALSGMSTRDMSSRLSSCANSSAGRLPRGPGDAKKDPETRPKKQNRPLEAAGSKVGSGATICAGYACITSA
jgi:hypothetical protein